LLHIISIGASERYFMSYYDGYNVSTKFVAETMYNFISNFFACDVCRNNFKKMYNSCGYDHCHTLSDNDGKVGLLSSKEISMELPIWVWKVHNGVNVRLIGERAMRNGRNVSKEEKEAAIWPTKKMCPRCRSYRGKWNHTMVYDFLRWKYWPGYEHLSKEFLNNDLNYMSIQNQSFVLIPFLLFGLVLARYILSVVGRSSRKYKKV